MGYKWQPSEHLFSDSSYNKLHYTGISKRKCDLCGNCLRDSRARVLWYVFIGKLVNLRILICLIVTIYTGICQRDAWAIRDNGACGSFAGPIPVSSASIDPC